MWFFHDTNTNRWFHDVYILAFSGAAQTDPLQYCLWRLTCVREYEAGRSLTGQIPLWRPLTHVNAMIFDHSVLTGSRYLTAWGKASRYPPLTHIEQCWSMDFVSDSLVNGNRFHALTVENNFNQKCQAFHAKISLKTEDVVSAIKALIMQDKCLLVCLKTENGSEFISDQSG